MNPNSQNNLNNLIKQNAVDFFTRLGYLNNNEVCYSPKIKYILTNKWDSRIFMADFDELEASAIIDRIISRIKELNISALWYVTPSSRPSNLKSLLNEHGFSYLKDWNAMAIDTTINRNFDYPSGLEVKEVKQLSELENWAQVLVEGFEIEGKRKELYKNYFINLGTEDSNIHFYLGILDEKPSASALLFEGQEAAGIYYVGTITEARRKGVAEAMTNHLLNEAKNKGFNITVLHASGAGCHLYKKIGFKECYTTNIYKY